jgi:hypothetical protein
VFVHTFGLWVDLLLHYLVKGGLQWFLQQRQHCQPFSPDQVAVRDGKDSVAISGCAPDLFPGFGVKHGWPSLHGITVENKHKFFLFYTLYC